MKRSCRDAAWPTDVPTLQDTFQFFSRLPPLPSLSTSLRLGHELQPLSLDYPARTKSREQGDRRRSGKRLLSRLEVDRDHLTVPLSTPVHTSSYTMKPLGFSDSTFLARLLKFLRKLSSKRGLNCQSMTSWRNGSASDSSSGIPEGYPFKSGRGHCFVRTTKKYLSSFIPTMLGLSYLRRLGRTPLNLKKTVSAHGYTTTVNAGVHSLNANSSPEDLDAARAWIEKFRSFAIRREDVSLTFARSSGPGGQVSSVSGDYWLVLTHSTILECEQGQYKGHRYLSFTSILDPGME